MSIYKTNSFRLCRTCTLALRFLGSAPKLCSTCNIPPRPLTSSRLRRRQRRRQEATRHKGKQGLAKGPFETGRRRATQGSERSPVRDTLQRPLGRARSKSQSHVKLHSARPQARLSTSPANRPWYLAAGLKAGESVCKENLFGGLFFTLPAAQNTSLSTHASSTPPRGSQGRDLSEGRDYVLKGEALVPEPQPSDVLFYKAMDSLLLDCDDSSPTPPSTASSSPSYSGSSRSSAPSGWSGWELEELKTPRIGATATKVSYAQLPPQFLSMRL